MNRIALAIGSVIRTLVILANSNVNIGNKINVDTDAKVSVKCKNKHWKENINKVVFWVSYWYRHIIICYAQ